MADQTIKDNPYECPRLHILAVADALNVVSGKWKLPILALLRLGKKRFGELASTISGITPRSLSKELKELELNNIIVRREFDVVPKFVEYELTDSGRKLSKMVEAMIDWGIEHRSAFLKEMAKEKEYCN